LIFIATLRSYAVYVPSLRVARLLL